jgi:hypothetical protein
VGSARHSFMWSGDRRDGGGASAGEVSGRLGQRSWCGKARGQWPTAARVKIHDGHW